MSFVAGSKVVLSKRKCTRLIAYTHLHKQSDKRDCRFSALCLSGLVFLCVAAAEHCCIYAKAFSASRCVRLQGVSSRIHIHADRAVSGCC